MSTHPPPPPPPPLLPSDILTALSTCPSCVSAIAEQNLSTPLYHCPSCTRARSQLRSALLHPQHRGFAMLRGALYPYVRHWGSRGARIAHIDPAMICVAHLLVMTTEATKGTHTPTPTPTPTPTTTGQKKKQRPRFANTLLAFAWSLITHAWGYSSNPESPAMTQVTGVGQLLCSVLVAWVHALPLSCMHAENPPHWIVTAFNTLLLETQQQHHQQQHHHHHQQQTHNTGAMQRFVQSLVVTFPSRSITPTTATPCSSTATRPTSERKHNTSVNRTHQSSSAATPEHLPVPDGCSDFLPRLPQDVLGVTFSFLTPARVIWGCCLLNKSMSVVCRDTLLWRHIFQTKWSKVQCGLRCRVAHAGGDDAHDWRRMYIQRRLAVKKGRLKGWKLSKEWGPSKKSKKRHKKKTVGAGTKGTKGTKWVVLCTSCGCNFIAENEKEMHKHWAENADQNHDLATKEVMQAARGKKKGQKGRRGKKRRRS